MVKKKGKSKRIALKDKYKFQRRVLETHRKRRKQAKKDAANGVVRNKRRDPGIPNSWPFKQELLQDIARARERQATIQKEAKERRKSELQALRQHQAQGGSARTVQELMAQAKRDQATYQAKTSNVVVEEQSKSDGTVAVGQQSRRAYLRELKKVVDTADVILQVLDARDPLGSRIHPSIEDAILSRSDKRMVLVLNKIDLVPKEIVGGWLTALRRSHPTIAIKASLERNMDTDDAASLATTSTAAVGMDGLLQLLKNYARTGDGGNSKTTIVVGIIGYPNVGKSSIINALKRSRAVGVSPRPGFTKNMQEVVLDKNVRLLDSPGVVFDDASGVLSNAVDAESMEDPIAPVEELLKRCDHASLLMTYNIPSFSNVDMFLALVAKSYGRVLKGGIPDKKSAARSVLKDWNQGKISYYTPPPIGRLPQVSRDAVIVTQFGKEFDLSKYDDEVMKGLDAKDEMDFVRLQGEETEQATSAAAPPKDLLNVLQGDADSDDEEMDQDKKATTSAAASLKTREQVAMAEDYDFGMM